LASGCGSDAIFDAPDVAGLQPVVRQPVCPTSKEGVRMRGLIGLVVTIVVIYVILRLLGIL
jgi:hypothetical protein